MEFRGHYTRLGYRGNRGLPPDIDVIVRAILDFPGRPFIFLSCSEDLKMHSIYGGAQRYVPDRDISVGADSDLRQSEGSRVDMQYPEAQIGVCAYGNHTCALTPRIFMVYGGAERLMFDCPQVSPRSLHLVAQATYDCSVARYLERHSEKPP